MKRVILIITTVLLLTNCSMTKPVKVAEVKRYTLTQVSSAKYSRRHRPDVYISRVTADPGYNTSAMVYLKTPYELKSFSKSAWVASPGDILHGLLMESLRRSNLFHAVLAPPFSGYTKYRLDTKIVVLHQEFFRHPSRVRLIVNASLINNDSHKTIAQHRFQVVKKAHQENPYGGVVAANLAVKDCQTQIVRFIAHQHLV